MEINISQCEAIIKNLSGKWLRRIPSTAGLAYDDLVQEGWVAYCLCIKGDLYDPEKGKSFGSFLYYAVNSRFKNLLTAELVKKRARWDINLEQVEDPQTRPMQLDSSAVSTSPDQESQAMLAEALAALSEVSVDFVKMIVEGAPTELLGISRRRMRNRLKGLGFDPVNGKIRIEKSMIEHFFGVNIEELKKLYYSYI